MHSTTSQRCAAISALAEHLFHDLKYRNIYLLNFVPFCPTDDQPPKYQQRFLQPPSPKSQKQKHKQVVSTYKMQLRELHIKITIMAHNKQQNSKNDSLQVPAINRLIVWKYTADNGSDSPPVVLVVCIVHMNAIRRIDVESAGHVGSMTPQCVAWWKVLFIVDVDEVHIIRSCILTGKCMSWESMTMWLLHRRANSSAKVKRSDRIRWRDLSPRSFSPIWTNVRSEL